MCGTRLCRGRKSENPKIKGGGSSERGSEVEVEGLTQMKCGAAFLRGGGAGKRGSAADECEKQKDKARRRAS